MGSRLAKRPRHVIGRQLTPRHPKDGLALHLEQSQGDRGRGLSPRDMTRRPYFPGAHREYYRHRGCPISLLSLFVPMGGATCVGRDPECALRWRPRLQDVRSRRPHPIPRRVSTPFTVPQFAAADFDAPIGMFQPPSLRPGARGAWNLTAHFAPLRPSRRQRPPARDPQRPCGDESRSPSRTITPRADSDLPRSTAA